MITKKDIETFKFINRFGKSYIEVLGKTIYPNLQSARNRLNILYKQGFIKYWNTGLMTPRRAIILSEEIKIFLANEHDIKSKNAKLNASTIFHNMLEQLADYYISKLSNSFVERTTVYEYSKKLNHIPDLLLHHEKGKIFIEVETSKKNPKRYIEIFEQMKKDNIIMVIYITKNQKTLESFAATFPKWERLYFLTIDNLITNIKTKNQLEPIAQNKIL